MMCLSASHRYFEVFLDFRDCDEKMKKRPQNQQARNNILNYPDSLFCNDELLILDF